MSDRSTSIRASQLRNFSITGEDIKDNSVPGAKLIDGTIPGSKLAEDYLVRTEDSVLEGSLKINGTTKASGYLYAGTSDPTNSTRLNYDGYFYATKVYNAVYNDIADFQKVDDEVVYGKAYRLTETGAKICNERCQLGVVGICSDTFGFGVGISGEGFAPFAVSGWVLAYVDKTYAPGTPLTCDEDGNLTEMTPEEKRNYPERLIAIYDRPETAEFWGPNDEVRVNGRHWVKVK